MKPINIPLYIDGTFWKMSGPIKLSRRWFISVAFETGKENLGFTILSVPVTLRQDILIGWCVRKDIEITKELNPLNNEVKLQYCKGEKP